MLKNDFFWMSQGKVATCDRWGGQICKVFTVHIKFSQDLTYQKLLKSVDFDRIIQNTKRWTFLGDTGYIDKNMKHKKRLKTTSIF